MPYPLRGFHLPSTIRLERFALISGQLTPDFERSVVEARFYVTLNSFTLPYSPPVFLSLSGSRNLVQKIEHAQQQDAPFILRTRVNQLNGYDAPRRLFETQTAPKSHHSAVARRYLPLIEGRAPSRATFTNRFRK